MAEPCKGRRVPIQSLATAGDDSLPSRAPTDWVSVCHIGVCGQWRDCRLEGHAQMFGFHFIAEQRKAEEGALRYSLGATNQMVGERVYDLATSRPR
ncbi:hypothetical protein J6590_052331 [Homalodisca vitripennis]|nr:hypothetical protein J6590_052331 [Homalodisca vitripennis]